MSDYDSMYMDDFQFLYKKDRLIDQDLMIIMIEKYLTTTTTTGLNYISKGNMLGIRMILEKWLDCKVYIPRTRSYTFLRR